MALIKLYKDYKTGVLILCKSRALVRQAVSIYSSCFALSTPLRESRMQNLQHWQVLVYRRKHAAYARLNQNQYKQYARLYRDIDDMLHIAGQPLHS